MVPLDTVEELNLVEGCVDAVIYQNEENGYTVLRIDAGDQGGITVVGCIPCVAPGEHLTVSGVWENHPQHGEQLRAVELERTLPEEEEDIFAYLSSGVCKGVGPTTARRIVDRFGVETLDILEREPERLNLIKGIWNGIGNPVYPPAKAELARHGISCEGKRARQVTRADYAEYDYLIGMDGANIRNMLRIFGGDPEGKVAKLLSYAGSERDISDPWYTGDFGTTYDDVLEGCTAFLEYLQQNSKIDT